MRIVTTVASRPMTIDTRAPWTVRLRMSRPSSSVPRMCSGLGGSSRPPVAVVAVSSGPTNSSGAMARIVKNTMMTSPTTPSGRPTKRRANAPPARDAKPQSLAAQVGRIDGAGGHAFTRGSRMP